MIFVGAAALLFAFTPLMPLAAVLAVVGLIKTRRAPAGKKRTWARVLYSVVLVACAVMTPFFLMFLDNSGLLRK